MVELRAMTVIAVINVRTALVALHNAAEHDPIKCIVLDLVAFQPVAHHITQVFRVKTERLLSYNQLLSYPVIFDGNDIKSLESFSFHLLLMHHSVFVHVLVDSPIAHPNRMVHSIELNSAKIILSTIPAIQTNKKNTNEKLIYGK